MISTKFFFIPVVSLFIIGFCVYAVAQKPSAATPNSINNSTVQDEESGWSVYMEAPKYHFALAKKYLQNGDYSKASAELIRGNSFLVFQQKRLATISKVIMELSNGMVAGKNKGIMYLDSVTSNALKVLSNKYVMVPLDIDATTLFEEEYLYRFDQAKTKLQESSRVEAGVEIRKAASLLKLRAANIATISKIELDSRDNALKNLATKVESGDVKEIKELDREFQKALVGISKIK